MKRRAFLEGVVALSGSASLPTVAQPVGRIYRIGVILATSRANPATARNLRPFEEGLRELGYIEGRNLVIEWRQAEGHTERMPALAAELVTRKVDLIVAGADSAAVAARKATDAIPIVFVASSDPVALGLVASLPRPGGNATGLASFSTAITSKQLELLREVFPGISRVAVINSPAEPNNALQLTGMREASNALRLQMKLHDANAENLDDVLRAIAQERPEALQVFLNGLTYMHQRRITQFAATERIPAVYGQVDFVESGGLMSYSFSYSGIYRRSVVYVDKILKGARPADLPVEQPTKLDLAINLKIAKALGLTIPQSVLVRADRVIE